MCLCLLPVCRQQQWFMRCLFQSKGSVVASSSVSLTRKWWFLCTSLWLCFNTELWCDLIKWKKKKLPMTGSQCGLNSPFQVLEVPIKASTSSHTSCWPVQEWVLFLPALSRQKMHGLFQFLPPALLTLPFMPRFPEKAEGLCWLGLHGLSEPFWVLWQSLNLLLIGFCEFLVSP